MASSEEPLAQASSTPSGDESKFRDLLDRLPQTVFEFDLDGRFVYVNRTGLERFGYSEDDLARGVSVIDTVIPAERDHLRANIARRLGGGETEGFQYTALRKDGGTFPALVHDDRREEGRPPVWRAGLPHRHLRARARRECLAPPRGARATHHARFDPIGGGAGARRARRSHRRCTGRNRPLP